MKIYIQKPFGILDCACHKCLIENPSEKVEYCDNTQKGLLTSAKNFRNYFWLKQFIKKILRFIDLSLPNAYYSKVSKDVELIHCTNCLSKNSLPWVAEMEHMGHFWWGSHSKSKKKIIDGKPTKIFDESDKNKVRKYLNSDYCKKIIPWSEWTKNNIIREFPELRKKVEVVYPATKIQKKKNKNYEIFRILFVGRDFKIKGGEIALQVMDKLTKKYSNVEGVVVSEVPKGLIKKYSKNKKINFLGVVPQKTLFEKIYPISHVFLYPTFSDTFGFAILEAKSFGLPVIAMKTLSTHTIEETITNGKTGFIIDNKNSDGLNRNFDSEIINKFTKNIEKLIKNKKLLKIMENNSRKELKDGKFSIKERNLKLEKIYEEALNNAK